MLSLGYKSSRTVASLLRVLLPSFVADRIWPDYRPTWRCHPTSYLDGLRGIASFIVFLCHYTELRHTYFVHTYGLNPDGEASAWIQLPFVRLLYSGRPMVHIFFVISGFVLSAKPIRLLHARDVERCYTTLASSVFRRPIRLFLPCAVSTLGIAALAQTGVLYSPAGSVAEQLHHWRDVFFRQITWPWAWDADLLPGYDIHLWTIPIEFAHSMLLFLVLLGLSRLRTALRMAATALLVVYCVCAGKWAGFEFLAGLFLAELYVLQQGARGSEVHGGGRGGGRGGDSRSRSSSQSTLVDGRDSTAGYDDDGPPRVRRQRLQRLRLLLHTGIIVTVLYVAGWPNVLADQTPGIRTLLAQTPSSFVRADDDRAQQKFWFGVSAILLVWSCGEVDAVRRLLETSVAQYLGRISYAIYIVHGPGLDYWQDRVLGWPAEPARGEPGSDGYVAGHPGSGVKGTFGVSTPTQRVVTWAVGLAILGPVMVWLSDLFWRLVDAPIVLLGRAVEKAVVVDEHVPETKERREAYGLA